MKKQNNADLLLIILLAAWWILNLVQAAFTGLANDEAYYWVFARELAWGYFDHPPVTALLVKLGDFIGGELGIRIFFTLLQPIYLYILWRLIRPASPSRRDALLFAVICFAIPVLQLYGFIAVPDGPLMLGTAIFLWAYNRFCKNNGWIDMLLLGLSMALLAYCKYQGALVVLFTFCSNPKILLNPKLYLSGVLTLALYLPHFAWQYDHDWASFHYHLAGRNGYFRWNYISEFWLNLLLIFNPLYVPLYFKAWGKGRYADAPVQKALYTITGGFVVFFTLSSLRGYVQPQWVIPITFGLIMILFGGVRESERMSRYVLKVGYWLAGLMLAIRLVAIFDPLNIKFEIFDNEESYEAIAEVADGRTVIFRGNYSVAAKYRYYTGNEAYCQPNINYRTSQWMFLDIDRRAAGSEIIVEVREDTPGVEGTIELANGKKFSWMTVSDFRPVREVKIEVLSEVPEVVTHGKTLRFEADFVNPYDYDVTISKSGTPLRIVWGRNKEVFNEYTIETETFTIPAKARLKKSFEFVVPNNLDKPEYRVGLIIKNSPLESWFNSDEYKIEIQR